MPFPVEIKWVTQTEARLGVRFPASYVTAMCHGNGGAVETKNDRFELFPIRDQSDRRRLIRTCNSVDLETATARRTWTGFPAAAVAIGSNGAGDLLILIPMEDHPDALQHQVYWWDHETGAVESAASDFGDLKKS